MSSKNPVFDKKDVMNQFLPNGILEGEKMEASRAILRRLLEESDSSSQFFENMVTSERWTTNEAEQEALEFLRKRGQLLLVENLRASFGLDRKRKFSPNSLWFSYGSNLNKAHFNNKMKKRDSALTLRVKTRATLKGYKLALDNYSEGHGLGYAVHCQKGEFVQGIVQEVPLEDLAEFLIMEGVLNKSHRVRDQPNYRIIEIKVRTDIGNITVFSLEGNKLCGADECEKRASEMNRETKDYIEASRKGARQQGIDDSRFVRDLEWAKSTAV